MAYEMHRVFCATPAEMEEEREAFHKTLGEFNESAAMARNVLMVAVSLPAGLADKRGYAAPILQNIRDARYYVQLLEDSWGPPVRDFERDYLMAVKATADPAYQTEEAVLIFKKPLLPHRVDPAITALKESLRSEGKLIEFEEVSEVRAIFRQHLERWLEAIRPAAPTP